MVDKFFTKEEIRKRIMKRLQPRQNSFLGLRNAVRKRKVSGTIKRP